jgi:hypothetical protein
MEAYGGHHSQVNRPGMALERDDGCFLISILLSYKV